MWKISKKTRRLGWFFCALAILCFYQTGSAQSRRVPQKPKTDSTEQTAPVESKPSETKTEKTEEKASVKIASLKLVGEVQHNFPFYKSNDLDGALKEFIGFTKLVSKTAPEMTRGDKKMGYDDAKELAKKETDAFVLWIGFAAKDDGYGIYIDLLQYAILKPQSGEVLTRGQFKPGETELGKANTKVNIPAVRTRTIGIIEMKNSVRELSAILVRGGWFG